MGFSLTRKAQDDLIDIYAAGCRLFGLAQAERYQDGLEAAFAFLADNPLAARQRPELSPPARIHPYQAHIIIYHLVDEDIVVLRVRHGHENWAAGSTGFHEGDDPAFQG